MSKKETGGPVFLVTVPPHPQDVGARPQQFTGIELRDYLAAAALQGILACFRDYNGAETVEKRCAKAYEYADAMIAERAK